MGKHLVNYNATLHKTHMLLELQRHKLSKDFTVYTSETPDDADADYLMALMYLPHAKIFEVSDTIKELLLATDNFVTPTRLPFNPTFIEATLYRDLTWHSETLQTRNQKYYGLMLVEGEPLKAFADKHGNLIHLSHLVKQGKELLEKPYPNIYIYAVTSDAVGEGHIKISLYNEYTASGVALEPQWQDERDFLRKFVMNFLDFLNDPDVEMVKVLRSDKSVRKAIRKHKKLGEIKESNVVTLTGKLKIYVDRLQRHVDEHRHYSYRFWVRGHWRHLTARCWKNKRWLKVFIPPYVKGDGLLRSKRYYLNRTEEEKANGEMPNR